MDEQLKLIQAKNDCEWVVSTEQGRRFVWSLLSFCGIYRDIETVGGDVEAFKQIGRRQVGLHLLGVVSDSAEEKIFDMMREAKQREIEEKIYNDNRNKDADSRSIDTSTGSIADELVGYSDDTSGGGIVF